MDCLKNYIQIEGCSAPAYSYQVDSVTAEPSGLYINKDLPISLEQMDKIADNEAQTFLGVWDEVQDRGIKKFRIVVKAGYRELFDYCDIDADWFCENRESLAMPLLYFLGSELMFERMYSTRINRYTTIDIPKAKNLRAEFDAEFQKQLKAALELINDHNHQESGDIFTYVEVVP